MKWLVSTVILHLLLAGAVLSIFFYDAPVTALVVIVVAAAGVGYLDIGILLSRKDPKAPTTKKDGSDGAAPPRTED